MTNRLIRTVAAAAGACALTVGALTIGVPAAHAVTGTLKLDPTSGSGGDPVTVVTSGGCATPNATHFVVKLTGTGVEYTVPGSGSVGPTYETVNYMVGNTSLATIGSTGTSTSAMRVPLSKLFSTVKAENKGGMLPSGAYTLSFECRSKAVPTALSTFSTTVTIIDGASGLTFKEGAPDPITVVTAPKVTGQAKAGSTLKVSKGTWSPSDVKVTATWKIGSKTVSKSLSYKVKAADRGKSIKVTVTATKSGYTAGTWSKTIKVAK
jgi:hypothetical protein